MLLASGMSAIETEALIFEARQGEPGTTPTRFVEIPIPPTSPVVGRRLADLSIPDGSLVVKILRGGEVIVPGGQTTTRADDVLFVLTDMDHARTIEHLVNPNPPAADDSTETRPTAQNLGVVSQLPEVRGGLRATGANAVSTEIERERSTSGSRSVASAHGPIL